MADSNITKKALASAMKSLVTEVPFEKITIGDICERCHMHRKSFYYHFRDKYDLINWIFDSEIFAIVNSLPNESTDERMANFTLVCGYFYDHRQFYRKILLVTGQNSFSEHFRNYIYRFIQKRLEPLINPADEEIGTFCANFFADAMLCCIIRWLTDKNCVPPEEFVRRLDFIVTAGVEKSYKNLHP